MRLKILYDNDAKEGFRRGWGFSCLVNEKILFDTGADLNTLLFNIRKFNVDLNDITKVVFSHEHRDHVGGFEILGMLGKVSVYLLKSFSRGFKRRILSFPNVELREISKMGEIDDEVFTTGELGFFIKEQSLIVRTERGVTVITGCSHPGLENILKVASRLGEIYGVVGGFHGFRKLEKLRNLKLIVPCHCTMQKRRILMLYPESAMKCSCGCEFSG
ncbi:MBL fold metallo-hydrolase [Candidatus Bathyarchaeota archaeon]|nr:MAG: MBL fold metallo-hydrolase [Candidatus Bathyarchaeota archaeon]